MAVPSLTIPALPAGWDVYPFDVNGNLSAGLGWTGGVWQPSQEVFDSTNGALVIASSLAQATAWNAGPTNEWTTGLLSVYFDGGATLWKAEIWSQPANATDYDPIFRPSASFDPVIPDGGNLADYTWQRYSNVDPLGWAAIGKMGSVALGALWAGGGPLPLNYNVGDLQGYFWFPIDGNNAVVQSGVSASGLGTVADAGGAEWVLAATLADANDYWNNYPAHPLSGFVVDVYSNESVVGLDGLIYATARRPDSPAVYDLSAASFQQQQDPLVIYSWTELPGYIGGSNPSSGDLIRLFSRFQMQNQLF